jgi:DNA polymerase
MRIETSKQTNAAMSHPSYEVTYGHKVLFCDLETFNETPIQHGIDRYSEKAEILLWAYAREDGPVKVWDLTTGETMPKDLATALSDPETITVWHNGLGFDLPILRNRMPDICPPDNRVVDTMRWAKRLGLPGGLGRLCDYFGLDESVAKQEQGRSLMLFFSKPRPKNQRLRRATRLTHPEKWAAFIEYAKHDILAMREIVVRMTVSEHEEEKARPRRGRAFGLEGEKSYSRRGRAFDLNAGKTGEAPPRKHKDLPWLLIVLLVAVLYTCSQF